MIVMRFVATFLWTLTWSVLRRVLLGQRTPFRSRRLDVLVDVMRKVVPILVEGNASVLRGSGYDTPVQREIRRTETTLDAISASCFEPQSGADGPVMLFFHGGGYCIGSVGVHRDFLSRLCLAMGGRVWAIDYRLAPEHPFPAAIEDSLAAYRALMAGGTPPGRVCIGGDSAGGGLCVALLLELKRLNEPPPAAAVLVSPWVDHRNDYASFESCKGTDYLTADLAVRWSEQYRGGQDADDPLISPVHADLTDLPPLYIQWGQAEVLRDSIERFAELAKTSGVDVTTECAAGMPHGWATLAALAPEGQPAIERLACFVRRTVN